MAQKSLILRAEIGPLLLVQERLVRGYHRRYPTINLARETGPLRAWFQHSAD